MMGGVKRNPCALLAKVLATVLVTALVSALVSALLTACGGGSSTASNSPLASGTAPVIAPVEAGAPQLTGNTATDAVNWFNFRRQQVGLQVVNRNSRIDSAAQGHADYQKTNNITAHEQILGRPGFTGVGLIDRLRQAGFVFSSAAHAYGEVISSIPSTSGVQAAEELVTAIYHRFVIFEPMFREMGAGAATSSGAYTYMTADFVTDGLPRSLGIGKMLSYPFDGQINVLTSFDSDTETPDPVPGKAIVGMPVSVHADLASLLVVQTFSIAKRGSANLDVRLLSAQNDSNTPSSAAAIVPLTALEANTIYDVKFVGSVDGVATTRNWSFTTR